MRKNPTTKNTPRIHPGEGHFQIALVAEGYLREKLRKKAPKWAMIGR